LHPHVLKHSIAMDMIREAGIENTRVYLGHKSGASTMEYLKPNDDEASAAVVRAERSRSADRELDLNRDDEVGVQEALRRAMRILEQAGPKGSKRARKNNAGRP